jgi:hypothetical protein
MVEHIVKRRQLLAAAFALPAFATMPRRASAAADRSFSFALVGDNPYSEREESELQRVLASIDDDCEFVIHIGDIKSGWESCADSLLQRRRALLQANRSPLVYTPGDNEWSDCHRVPAGGFAPFERLAALRKLFFSRSLSLGLRDMPLQRQSDLYKDSSRDENVRWRYQGIQFVTVNRPGGVQWDSLAESEAAAFRALESENERWLRDAFELARRESLPAVVIAAHADPFFERDARISKSASKSDTQRPFRRLLQELSESFAGQVLFLHGDTHRFRADQPIYDAQGRVLERFTRVESFGSPFGSSWVRIFVTPQREPMFTVAVRHLPAKAS